MYDVNRGAKTWLATRLIRRPGKPNTTDVHLLVETTAVSCVPTTDQPDFIPTSNNGFFQ
jgi:hypothetical protein